MAWESWRIDAGGVAPVCHASQGAARAHAAATPGLRVPTTSATCGAGASIVVTASKRARSAAAATSSPICTDSLLSSTRGCCAASSLVETASSRALSAAAAAGSGAAK
eukprot:3842130-Prymnesium_polylepis.2